MAKLRTDGLYISVIDDGREYLRFFDDGTMLFATVSLEEPPKKVLASLVPKAGARGNFPAPVVFDGGRLSFTIHDISVQIRFDGTWSKDRLELDATSTIGVTQRAQAFVFVDAKTLASGDKKALAHLQPPPREAAEAPPSVAPKGAKTSHGYHWVYLERGAGAKVKPTDRAEFRITSWGKGGPSDSFNNWPADMFAQLQREGDSIRIWERQDDGTVEITDYLLLKKAFDGPVPPFGEGGLFVGPEVDGVCTVIRFDRRQNFDPLRAVAAYVPPKHVAKLLSKTGGIAGVFIATPPPVQLDGNKMRFLTHLALAEQVTFEGTWSATQLVLNEHHAGPDATVGDLSNVVYTYRTATELKASGKGKAAPAPAKKKPAPAKKNAAPAKPKRAAKKAATPKKKATTKR